ncbi:MAG: DMT family transporter [Myxococcaceae bacterium]|nr:DMT family transporter [Myxococcaceae bacterium]
MTTPLQPAVAVPAADAAAREVRIGILFLVGGGLFMAVLDTVNRYLTHTYPVLEVIWGRYFFQVAVTPFVIPPSRLRETLKTSRPGLQILRSLFLMGSSLVFLLALQVMRQVDATSIGRVGPLMVTALSVWILKEKVGLNRWIAVFVGFAGALIIIRPGFGASWGMFLPLGAALQFALYQVLTRQISKYDSPLTTFAYSGLVGVVVMTFVLPFVWQTPDLRAWGMMCLVGVLASLHNFALIHAFKRAPASVLAPFGYLQILWVTLLGFVVFGDVPDAITLFGGMLIVGAGIYVATARDR